MRSRGISSSLLVVALALSGCGAFDSPSPAASCRPLLIVDGTPYRPFEGEFTLGSVGAPPELTPGEPVADAKYGGCDDGGGLQGGGPTDAWRAPQLGDRFILTPTACARMEGTEPAADCDPDALPYLIWEPDVDSSASPQP